MHERKKGAKKGKQVRKEGRKNGIEKESKNKTAKKRKGATK